MALQILIHTFRMIFGNLAQALRASVGPYLILILSVSGLFMVIAGGSGNSIGSLPILMLVIIPLALFVTAWVAVSWHRFILLEEYAGILPAVAGRPIWPYAGKALLLGLIIIFIAVPLMYLIGALGLGAAFAPSGLGSPTGQSSMFVALIIFAAVLVFMSYISLRLGISLVGTALGKPLGFGDSWAATKKISGVIFGVAVLLVLINTIPGMVLSQMVTFAPVVVSVLNIALSWLTMMLGISILTTIYGHVIEDRPLVS
jgi:hypothetical protein